MRIFFIINLLLFFCLTNFQSFSQSDSIYHLKEYEISVSRTGGTLKETFRTVSVITSDQIQLLPVKSVEELLSYVSGVDLRQRGPAGVQSDLSIRGGTFEQALVLINGFKISDPQTGHHNLNLPISLSDIERIEILKGPGSRIYGQNAFTGAINIITKTASEKKVNLNFTAGENNYLAGIVSGSLPLGKYKQSLTLVSKSSSGYITNTDFDIKSAWYQANWGKSLELNAGFIDKQFGANGFYSNLFPWQWEHTQTSLINLGWKKDLNKFKLETKAQYRHNSDDFVLKRDTPTFYRNLHNTDVLGAEINTNYNSKFGKTALGVEFRYEILSSTSLGNHERQLMGIYLEHRLILKRLIITPGAYAGWNNNYGFQWFPGIDIGYMISNKIDIYADAGRSFRIPSFTELYYVSPANMGNTELKPEKAISFEFGTRYHGKSFESEIDFFKRNATNLIDWGRENDTLPWKAMNITSINTFGFEGNFVVKLDKLFSGQKMFQNLTIQYSKHNAEQLPGQLLSKNVLDFIENQLILGLNYKNTSKFSQSWFYVYEDRLGYSPHGLFDTRINLSIKNFKYYIEASNLLNVKYYEFGGVQLPGRWISGGVEFSQRFN